MSAKRDRALRGPEFRHRNSKEPRTLKINSPPKPPRLFARATERHDYDAASVFSQWSFTVAMFHRGYVLAAFLYFVVDAHLTTAELTLLGTIVSLTQSLTDVPAGAWADAIGRRWSLVIGHLLLAAGMMMTGFVTAFPLLIMTQMVWALGWAFIAGADVAWFTDEFDGDGSVDAALAASLRMRFLGGAAGMLASGILSRAIGLAAAIVICGAGIAMLSIPVAIRFRERKFAPARSARPSALVILRRGFALASRDREIMPILAATFLSEGATIVGWLFPKRLVSLGVSGDPVVSWTAIGIMSFIAGAASLRAVESFVDRPRTVRRIYELACGIGLAGIFLLALASDVVVVGLGMVLVWGVAFNLTRSVSVVWVNRRTTSDVRATVLSCLSQAETLGEIACGSALTGLAKAGDLPFTLLAAGALLALAPLTLAGF